MATPLVIEIPEDQLEDVRNRLLKNIRRLGNGCWEWARSRNDAGYGKICIQRKLYRTHRIAFVLFRGPIPDGLLVCHTCDNPPCCNPDHLFLGTTIENAEDMLRKNRQVAGGACVSPENRVRGERSSLSKLTASQVEEIRRDYRPRKVTYKMLAARFGVHPATVLNVIVGKTWLAPDNGPSRPR